MVSFLLCVILACRERKLSTSFFSLRLTDLKVQGLTPKDSTTIYWVYDSLEDEEEVLELLTLNIKRLSTFSTF